MTDSVERFSNRVANYVKYRPDYPQEIVPFLAENCGLTSQSVIADVGCGTGISTKMFLENGNRVLGVEPNEAMRDAAIECLKEFPDFKPINGTSTDTTLDDRSIDMVVAAQAFHWFDAEPTRAEFERILKPDGYVVLIWNERQIDTTAFHAEYEAFLIRYARDYEIVRHENLAADELARFYQHDYASLTFPNHQDFDFDGLKGRMLSASYMPNEQAAVFPEMISELQTIFAKHERNGRIRVLYDTNVYFSRL